MSVARAIREEAKTLLYKRKTPWTTPSTEGSK